MTREKIIFDLRKITELKSGFIDIIFQGIDNYERVIDLLKEAFGSRYKGDKPLSKERFLKYMKNSSNQYRSNEVKSDKNCFFTMQASYDYYELIATWHSIPQSEVHNYTGYIINLNDIDLDQKLDKLLQTVNILKEVS